MARKTKDEAAKTREAILEAAIAVFLRKGVAHATLRDIAEESGHTRGAVYHHFENKLQILGELLESVRLPSDAIWAEFEAVAKEDPLEGIRRWSTKTMGLLLSDEKAARIHTILFHRCEFVEETNPLFEMECSQTRAHFEAVSHQFERARAMGHLRTDIEPAEAAFAHYSLCLGMYTSSLREPWLNAIDLRVPHAAAIDALIRGMRA